MRDREAEEFIVTSECIHVVNAFEARKESVGRTKRRERDSRGWERVGGVETRQDRGAGGRMAVRIYGRFITLPALPRLL
ncbi:hypothetical protein ALC62_06393 [Cyphomyrmex costatus]|uniref:Uncharacterized protein n=1 Tax=Cyphomyrmex costatus TaxID=456900 RepID=A0A195CQA3_9HYME|nr:hypothetical protein ALC62_06393 [Cyphomyrmex costatus]